MRTNYFIIASTITFLLASCGGNKAKTNTRLIEEIEQLQVDTVVTPPDEVLCSVSADEVLRRYPELYHSSKKAIKTYNLWAKQVGNSKLTDCFNISEILNKVLQISSDQYSASEWPDMSGIDKQYLMMIDQATTAERKTVIGRERHTWKEYMAQLQNIVQTLPEECRAAYISEITASANTYLDDLKKASR